MTSPSACSFPRAGRWSWSSIEDPQAKWAKAVEVAKLADDLGLDSLWVYDHFHNVPVPAHETMFECWTTMAAISQVTSRIKLGQMVGCSPYRTPVAAGEDHLEHRRDVRRPAHLGHRRRVVRARVQGLRLPVPQGVGPDRGAPRDGRDREGDVERARRAATTGSTSSSTARSATRSRSSSRTRRSSSAAAASSSRFASWPGSPTRRTSAASSTSSSTRPRCSSSTARTSAATTTRSRRRCRGEIFIRETEAEVRGRGQPSRSGASRSSRGPRATSWARPSRSPSASRPTSTSGCTGFYPWCSDYPDTETVRLLRREGRARAQVRPRSLVVAEDVLAHAARLRRALALEGEAHHHLAPPAMSVTSMQLHADPQRSTPTGTGDGKRTFSQP